jgi:HAD superfamily hydrolase (TIGR01549 family)
VERPVVPRWIFLDVGNVLLDEDALAFHAFRRHTEAIAAARPDRAPTDLLAEFEALALGGSAWPLHDLAATYLDPARLAEAWDATDREVRADYARFHPPLPRVGDALARLASVARLGLIANQPAECRAALDRHGLLSPFEVVALSGEVGHRKPSPGLFRHALGLAGAEPSDCLMVGDRLDADVAPARSLGLATAWLRRPARSADDPAFAAYLAALRRVDDARAARLAHVRPDLTFDALPDLADALDAPATMPARGARP